MAGKERRKFLRYDTAMKIYYRVNYDIKTKVKFQLLDIEKQKRASRRYSGLTKNISIEGLGFISKKKLAKGDVVFLEVFVPNVKVHVRMTGEIRWSRKIKENARGKNLYRSGVKLLSANGKAVNKSIHFDKKYKVAWSVVLEEVFGNFKKMARKLRKKKLNLKED